MGRRPPLTRDFAFNLGRPGHFGIHVNQLFEPIFSLYPSYLVPTGITFSGLKYFKWIAAYSMSLLASDGI
jgi:hypothetical protein